MKLSFIIEKLVGERGINRATIESIVVEGIRAAYEKKYPEASFRIDYDSKTDQVLVEIEKRIVATVADEIEEISLRKARFIDKNVVLGDTIWIPFEKKIGRIEILYAKQVIASHMRKIEAQQTYQKFKAKEGAIVHGVIHTCERNGFTIKVQDTMAFLPKSLTIPTDKCTIGYPIRALLKEVLEEPRNETQLILDRTSEQFLRKLFELEIPEIFERLVEVKKVSRIAGYKSKVVVASNDVNIDPVGTCIGAGGQRIRPILKEIGGERVDIIARSVSLEQFIKDALKPAQINRVTLVDDKNARVYLDEDQRSLAIGKMGQNITLASDLVGMSIHIVQSNTTSSKQNDVSEEFVSNEN